MTGAEFDADFVLSQLWLHDHRIDVCRTTILRFLKKLPELQSPAHGGANG